MGWLKTRIFVIKVMCSYGSSTVGIEDEEGMSKVRCCGTDVKSRSQK